MKKRALLGVTLLTFTTLAGCTNLSEQKSGEKQTEVACGTRARGALDIDAYAMMMLLA